MATGIVFDINDYFHTTTSWVVNGKYYSDKEYYYKRLKEDFSRYVSCSRKSCFPLLTNLDISKYSKILLEGEKAILTAADTENIYAIYNLYSKKLQEYLVTTDLTVNYYFYRCTGADKKEYISVICQTNPNNDGYVEIDDLYINGSNANTLKPHYETADITEFIKGLKTHKGRYSSRIQNFVSIGKYTEYICAISVYEGYCSTSGLNLHYKTRKQWANQIKEEYYNDEIEINWQTYQDKETRRQIRLAQDGRWTHETEMFKLIQSKYSDAQRQWRPKWLISEKGGQMSCDVYIPSLKTVFEYQGKQHFEPVPFFDKDEKSFERRQFLDKLKYDTLTKFGIKVCYINYNEKLSSTLIQNKLAAI